MSILDKKENEGRRKEEKPTVKNQGRKGIEETISNRKEADGTEDSRKKSEKEKEEHEEKEQEEKKEEGRKETTKKRENERINKEEDKKEKEEKEKKKDDERRREDGSFDNELVDQIIWAIGNLAGDTEALRDILVREGVIERLIKFFWLIKENNIRKNICWSLANLLRRKSEKEGVRDELGNGEWEEREDVNKEGRCPEVELRRKNEMKGGRRIECMKIFACILKENFEDEEVIGDALWSLARLVGRKIILK